MNSLVSSLPSCCSTLPIALTLKSKKLMNYCTAAQKTWLDFANVSQSLCCWACYLHAPPPHQVELGIWIHSLLYVIRVLFWTKLYSKNKKVEGKDNATY